MKICGKYMPCCQPVAPIDKLSVVFTILLAFLILKEQLSPKVITGGLLITAGAIVMMWK